MINETNKLSFAWLLDELAQINVVIYAFILNHNHPQDIICFDIIFLFPNFEPLIH